MTWVMLDYGGVLCHPPREADTERLARAAGAPVSDVMAGYWQWRDAYDRADLDTAGFWQRVGSHLGREYSAAQVAGLSALDMAMWLHLREDMTVFVASLAAKGVPLALLSNAPADMALTIPRLPLAAYFRHLVFSCDLRSAKPDAACYAAALERIGASAGEVLFLDDRAVNVAGAAAAGLVAEQFTTAAAAQQAVARHLASGTGSR